MVPTLSPVASCGRLRHWGGIVALSVLAAAALLYAWMTDPEHIRRRCEHYFGRFLDGEVHIESATFGLFDGIQLGGVQVTERGATRPTSSPERPFFYCRNLLLKHDPLAMLVGRLKVQEVVAVNPVCNLIRSDETGDYNMGHMLRGSARRESAERPPLPVVRLRNASLIITRDGGGERRDVDRISLGLLATPLDDAEGTYTLAWKREGAELTEGRSLLDLRTLSFKDLEGGLPWLSLETGMLAVATQVPDTDRWFSLLGLSGRIKAEGYDMSLGTGQGEPGRLTLRLRDASLSIPADEVERRLPLSERYLRFDGVEGVVELSQRQADVRFTGRFHGSPCRVSAFLAGELGPRAHLDDVSLSANITCEDFTLPVLAGDAAAVRFVERWRPLSSFYNDFDPHGRVSLEVALVKEAGPGRPVRLAKGMMTVLHADASYRKFPYRVRNLTGTVEFTPEGMYLRELAGDHRGAPVVVNGWLAETRWYAATDLHITGRSVSLDADLHEALNARYRQLWDTFELAGAADITVDMTRAPGTEQDPQPYVTTINAELSDARARFSRFPYPVEGLSGGVAIAGERLRVTRLRGRNGPARVVVDGYADLASEGLSDLNLRIEAEGVAFDDQLFAALPQEGRTPVALFTPQGIFDLAGNVTWDPSSGQAVYDLTATLRDVQMTYRIIPVPVEHVAGTLRVQPKRVTLEKLTGQRGGGTVTISGTSCSAAEQADSHIVVTCENLIADETLLAALPERMSRVCRDLRITGPLKSVTRYEKEGPVDAAVGTQHTIIDAAGASINAMLFPYPLTITRGTVTVEPGRVGIDDLHAAHGDTTVALDGALALDDLSVGGTVALSGAHVVLDEDLRLAVPWRWRRTWNKIMPTGALDLELKTLRYHRTHDASSADWDFEGRLVLDGVGLEAGVRATDLVGTLQGSGNVSEAAGGLSVSGAFALDSLSLNDRRVENVRGRLEHSAANGVLELADLSGALYGGLILADVHVAFEPGATRYDVTATMQDVDLREFLRAGKGTDTRYDAVAGIMDAHLFMTGSAGDPESRLGGGKVHIRNGNLYRLPLLLAILNVLHRGTPQEPAFQEMSAEFLITGKCVEIEDIIFQGPTLALVGSGTITPATGTVALTLVAVTPHRWVEVPVITEFFEAASRELVEIDVTGPLSGPVIRAKPLRGVEAAFQTLFEKKKPKKHKSVAPTRGQPGL
ncbi:MAG: hypothetical protein V2A79_18750 [Planctomycetota bacterium]